VIEPGEPLTLEQAERRGEAFAARWPLPANPSARDLRTVSTADILKTEPNYSQTLPPGLWITIDGYVFPKPPIDKALDSFYKNLAAFIVTPREFRRRDKLNHMLGVAGFASDSGHQCTRRLINSTR
jgi:hypothetical protein